jgi:inner membrane protein
MILDALSRLVRSPGFKFFLILALTLLLAIPLFLVWALVAEREQRARGVVAEIGALWGEPQQISGPYLTVPYTVRVTTQQGDKQVQELVTMRAVFLPEDLSIAGSTKSRVLSRSIYNATVYDGTLDLTGRFAAPDMAAIAPDAVSIRWADATLALGITDVSGLKRAGDVSIEGGTTLPFEPSIGMTASTTPGVHVRLGPLLAAATMPAGSPPNAVFGFAFKARLDLSGSQSLHFAPVARETKVTLTSDWPHPGFSGAFLPTDRSIKPDGFSASWTVPHLARSVPQSWSMPESSPYLDRLQGSFFGVDLHTPVDLYSLADRALKYGMMFLGSAFMAAFLMEVLAGRRLHPVQYVFVGLSLIVFYVLLLSLAEHIGFGWAFVLASLATAGMLGTYVGRALHSRMRGLIMAGLLLVLYGLLYLILVLEDYALLAGALAAFAMLTAAMFLTLRIDWSGGGATAASPSKSPKAS